jgi:hypothetical protein
MVNRASLKSSFRRSAVKLTLVYYEYLVALSRVITKRSDSTNISVCFERYLNVVQVRQKVRSTEVAAILAMAQTSTRYENH